LWWTSLEFKTEYAAVLKDRGMLIHDLVDVVVLLDKVCAWNHLSLFQIVY
jgi:hypothetical protein